MDRATLRKAADAALNGLRKSLGPTPRAPSIVSSVSCNLDSFAQEDTAGVWLGHASVLLRLAGKTVITDPVLSERIGLRVGPMTFGIDRLLPTPITVDDLPAIDIVLISHAHFDHLDKPTLRAIALKNPGAEVITARGTRRLIPQGFSCVRSLDWDATLRTRGLEISAIRPEHWGARTAIDRHRRWNAYTVTTRTGHRTLFAGDTAYTDAFERLSPVDLSIFGIGAYEPWNCCHANPEQVWEMHLGVRRDRGSVLLPMHHSTFPLGKEHVDEPMERLLRAAASDAGTVVCRRVGDLWTPHGESPAGRALAPARAAASRFRPAASMELVGV